MGTLEFLRKNVGKFFMYGDERCRLVGIEGAPDGLLVIEKKDGWYAKPDRFVQMWDGKVEKCLYVSERDLKPIEDVSAKQFVEDNAGRYYMFEGQRVRVVGYCSDKVIITCRRGWESLDYADMFTCKTKATRFWYVCVGSLEEIPLC